MIRFYCQYSFGGFRTFRIYGEEQEALVDQEVDRDNLLDFPRQGSTYFNYGGAKLVFRALDDGAMAIILRDIPGVEKDTDGRSINCALQVIGDAEDMPLMRNIILAIINDIEKFQTDFKNGFSLRGGLHYNGTFLADFVKKLEEITLSAPGTSLENLAQRTGPIYLFVPTSPLFLSDQKLRTKVMTDLQLGSTKKDEDNVLKNSMSESTLSDLKGKIISLTEVGAEASSSSEDLTDEVSDGEICPDKDLISSDNKRISDLELELTTLQKAKKALEIEKMNLEQRVKKQEESIHRSNLMVIGLAIGATAAVTALITVLLVK